MLITIPLYLYTSLPPVEIVNEVPHQTVTETSVPIVTEVVSNKTISVNITEGKSVFLAPQASPPLIDSDIVLVVDTSGSMDGTRITTAQTAIQNLVTILNQTDQTNLSHDRIGLVSFSGTNNGNWSSDAVVQSGLDYVSNQTHLNDVVDKANALIATGSTDIWAGLNYSVQMLLDNPRNTSSLQSIILMTDGEATLGPWTSNITTFPTNYIGFLSLPSNDTTLVPFTERGPYSESPVKVARDNGIKINTIGLFDNNGYGIDPNFLLNVSKNPDYGTFGEFFEGNDTLSLTESFLQARDIASGWAPLKSSSFAIQGNGTSELYSYNVTENTRRIKWDVNWNDSLFDVDLTLIDPNGTIINLPSSSTENIIQISNQLPKSFVIDFPMVGPWYFNVSWFNVTSSVTMKTRLSNYEPPIFINYVNQLNTTITNTTTVNNSVLFSLNATNKNPLFSLHDIKPLLLANFSDFNYTAQWNPTSVPELTVNSSITFDLNITVNEPIFIDGPIFFMVNSSEGYYDAYAQPLYLDYRVNTQNKTVESYIVTQTSTVVSQSTSLGYLYNKQVFDTLNWVGFLGSFVLLSVIMFIYIKSKESKLRELASKLRSQFFRDRTAMQAALIEAGVDVSKVSLDHDFENISHLDDLGSTIQMKTGTNLSPEALIKMVSGTNTEKIAKRISFVSGMANANVLQHISDSSSIDEITRRLNMSYDDFMNIITQDEKVLAFQEKIRSLNQGTQNIASSILVNDSINFKQFRSKLKKYQK